MNELLNILLMVVVFFIAIATVAGVGITAYGARRAISRMKHRRRWW